MRVCAPCVASRLASVCRVSPKAVAPLRDEGFGVASGKIRPDIDRLASEGHTDGVQTTLRMQSVVAGPRYHLTPRNP
jgi:hypothetical protein